MDFAGVGSDSVKWITRTMMSSGSGRLVNRSRDSEVVSRTLPHGDRAIKCVIQKLMVRRRTAQWGAYDVMS